MGDRATESIHRYKSSIIKLFKKCFFPNPKITLDPVRCSDSKMHCRGEVDQGENQRDSKMLLSAACLSRAGAKSPAHLRVYF